MVGDVYSIAHKTVSRKRARYVSWNFFEVYKYFRISSVLISLPTDITLLVFSKIKCHGRPVGPSVISTLFGVAVGSSLAGVFFEISNMGGISYSSIDTVWSGFAVSIHHVELLCHFSCLQPNALRPMDKQNLILQNFYKIKSIMLSSVQEIIYHILRMIC